MRSGGSNLTHQHAEDLSLCALFLMEASKRVAREFGACRTKSHTTRDTNKDITNMLNILLEKKVTQELRVPERTSVAVCNFTAGHRPISVRLIRITGQLSTWSASLS